MKVDVTVVGSMPYLLRTAHDVRQLCVSLGYIPANDPQQPEVDDRAADRVVELQEPPAPVDALPQVSDEHVRAGRLLAGSVLFATHDAQVRG